MLLGTLLASLLGNTISVKFFIRPGEGTKSPKGQEKIRVGQNF